MDFTLTRIGTVKADDEGFRVELDKRYIPALEGLEGCSYIQLLWWFDKCDNARSRNKLTESKPYTKVPKSSGPFV